VCEFDGTCAEGEFCIAGRCTRLDCFPGETVPCYGGPPGTAGIGECRTGYHLCTADGTFTRECIGEVVAREEVGLLACNGLDDDCDGEADDGHIQAVDIIFGFDISGSMHSHLMATADAIGLTAQMYNDPNIHLALVMFPNPFNDIDPTPTTIIPLLPYGDFALRLRPAMAGLSTHGAREANWDLPWLVARDEQPDLGLRPGAELVLIMFTDEQGQSYIDFDGDGRGDVDEGEMCGAARSSGMRLYFFVDPSVRAYRGDSSYPMSEDFDDCATIYNLSSDSLEMVGNISDLVENICEEE